MVALSLTPGSGLPLTGRVVDPTGVNKSAGDASELSLGQQGQGLMDQLHGKYYNVAKRGQVFIATTAIAGVTVPAPATTLASKAGMRNPVGSGVNVELISLSISSVTIEVALKQFAMEFQVKATSNGGAPTSITDLTEYQLPLSTGGSGNAKAKAYSAATMTNAAANPIVMPIFGNYETVVGFVPSRYDFDGQVVFGPDTVMCITCTAALAAVNLTYIWAEWPI